LRLPRSNEFIRSLRLPRSNEFIRSLRLPRSNEFIRSLRLLLSNEFIRSLRTNRVWCKRIKNYLGYSCLVYSLSGLFQRALRSGLSTIVHQYETQN